MQISQRRHCSLRCLAVTLPPYLCTRSRSNCFPQEEEEKEKEEEDSLALMRRRDEDRQASMDPRVSPLLSLFPFVSQLLHPFCLFQQSGIQNGFQRRCFNCPFRSNSIDAIGAIPGSIAFLESEKGFPWLPGYENDEFLSFLIMFIMITKRRILSFTRRFKIIPCNFLIDRF